MSPEAAVPGAGDGGHLAPEPGRIAASDIGEVDEVTIRPLVERLTIGDPMHTRLRGEAGLSYLVKAGDTTLLFDTGLNLRGDDRSPLVEKADVLGVDLEALSPWSSRTCTPTASAGWA